jgi:hypothetical protein
VVQRPGQDHVLTASLGELSGLLASWRRHLGWPSCLRMIRACTDEGTLLAGVMTPAKASPRCAYMLRFANRTVAVRRASETLGDHQAPPMIRRGTSIVMPAITSGTGLKDCDWRGRCCGGSVAHQTGISFTLANNTSAMREMSDIAMLGEGRGSDNTDRYLRSG